MASEASKWVQRGRRESVFLVLVITPAAIQSEAVRREWRYPREQGVCVYPVKGAPDAELAYGSLPKWTSDAHFFDLDLECETFFNYLKSPCHAVRVPFMAGEFSANFVQRAGPLAELEYTPGVSRGASKNPVAFVVVRCSAFVPVFVTLPELPGSQRPGRPILSR